MTLRCPEGHASTASDYCDTCGAPMVEAAGSPAAPVVSAPEEATPGVVQVCPNCAARNPADALFCESCGYDFTTGVLPRPAPLADGTYLPGSPTRVDPEPEAVEGGDSVPDAERDAAGDEPDGTPADAAVASESVASAEPAHAVPAGDVTPHARPSSEPVAADSASAASAAEDRPEGDVNPHARRTSAQPAETEVGPAAARTSTFAESPHPETPRVTPTPPPAETAEPETVEPVETEHPRRPAFAPPSRRHAQASVVEVWIDPDWFATQSTDEACPSPMAPDVVRLSGDSALIGRPSSSRRVRPDVDCGGDTGVSRQHARLTSDGRRWWLEDLGSSNGTFVGEAAGPLPARPIEPGRRVEVDADDRIYVGAWTRLVVRPATEAERTL